MAAPTLSPRVRYAAIYIRVSTTDQAERYSPGSQRDKLLAKAANEGFTVRREHIFEDHHTGKEAARPQFERLRALVKTGAVQAVLVLCVDRFARKVHDAALVAAEFKRHNCALDFVEMKNDDSPEGRLQFNVLASMAEYMGEKIVERGKDGRQRMMDDGRIPGGVPIFGHDCHPTEKGIRILNPPQAAIAVEMYELARGGMAPYAIAALYNARGIRSKGMNGKPPALWSTKTVQQLLTNRQYIGEYRTGGKLFSVPRIVSDELFFAVQEELAKKGTRWMGAPSENYLLRNFLFCHLCGHPFKGYHQRYYLCSNCTNKPPVKRLCLAPSVRSAPLDALAWSLIWTMLCDPAVLLSQAQAYVDALPKPVRDDQTSEMEQELAKLKRQKDNRVKMYRSGIEDFDDAAKAEMAEIKRRITFLESELNAIDPVLEFPAEEIVEAYAREIAEGDEPTTYVARRDILGGLEGLRMVYGEREVTITGRVPIGTPRACRVRETPGRKVDGSLTAYPNSAPSIPFILKGRVA